MELKTAADFHPEVLRCFDKYVHGLIDRRGFLDAVGKYAVGGVTATMLLEALTPQFALAQKVARTTGGSARATSSTHRRRLGNDARLSGAARERHGKLPGILVVARESRAQSAHRGHRAPSRARQFHRVRADALYPLGGYPGDEDKARELFAEARPDEDARGFRRRGDFLKGLPNCTGKIGAVGFCWGGGMVNMLATRLPDLARACRSTARSRAGRRREDQGAAAHPLRGNDERINAGWPAYESALKAAGVKYEMFQYAGTEHRLHNDTTPRYNEAAAKLAWERTVAFFNKTLRG
jgi:carboxymethylenebutenolidase